MISKATIGVGLLILLESSDWRETNPIFVRSHLLMVYLNIGSRELDTMKTVQIAMYK